MKKEILPDEYRKLTVHRITIRDSVFKTLELIRSKNRLWDREAAIIYLLEKEGYKIED